MKFYMERYEYNSYEEYKAAQVEANKRKIDKIWAVEEIIFELAAYIRGRIPNAKFGLCHGTRNGKEQLWFRKALGIEVIGTEISPTASNFPYTIEWDFHKIKPEWVNAVDFIFSNSLDHSYDPEYCLGQWMQCVHKSGICLIEWTEDDIKSKKSDPFGATLDEYVGLIEKNFVLSDHIKYSAQKIKEMVKDESNRAGLNYAVDRHYLVVAHR